MAMLKLSWREFVNHAMTSINNHHGGIADHEGIMLVKTHNFDKDCPIAEMPDYVEIPLIEPKHLGGS